MQPTNPQLCDYCHQKPIFPGHKFCSKSCASQAAALCNYCQKKPKFQNYDFCSKKCGSLANAKARNGVTQTPTVQSNQSKTTNTAAPQQKASNPTFDPVQMAKLIVQQIPQLQASVTPQNNANNTNSSATPHTIPANPASKTPSPSTNNPFLSVSAMATAQSASPASNVNVADSADPMQQPLAAECLIPGCGQPVHVTSDSKHSEYCSMRHREEAVASGLASPCIMCLTLPQSETDYFCSRECRQEALHKQVIGAA